MRTPSRFGLFPAMVLLGGLAACGGDSSESADPPTPSATSTSTSSSSPTPEPAVSEPGAAVGEILGEAGSFGAGGGDAVPLAAQVEGRECGLTEALFGSCRASTGAGGAFLVTAESTPEQPSVWNVVVRCGTEPAMPGASAQGDFQPMTSDLGLDPYGEVVGVTLVGDAAEAALVYQPEGSECPVVWGLGKVDRASLFTGGLDALSGDADPIAYTDAQGVASCAVADGQGGISVSPCA